MILTIAGLLILLLTFLRLTVALINMLSRPYLPHTRNQYGVLPSLSVLIPVRNEEKNIGNLLQALAALPFENAEILVYDDASTDGTAAIIREFAGRDGRVRLLTGSELPDGWTGKNRACHNLAEAAGADYLLFLDADVTVGDDLLRRAVAYAQDHDLALLSMFPEQEMKTPGEKIVVPFMFRVLLSLLPLFLVRRCRWTSFSAANGQMMLFRGEAYRKYRFHESVKEKLAEDIEIMKAVKKLRLRGETLVGRGEIRCRMYSGYKEGVNGFSRNIFTMFGNSWIFFLLFSLTGLGGWIILLLLQWYFLLTYILMVISLNAMIAVTSGQKVAENLRWLMPGIAAFYHISCLAVARKINRSYEWKGRRVG